MNERLCMGIDVGSTTAKVAVVDGNTDVVFGAYQRHNAETLDTLRTILEQAIDTLGDVRVDFRLTGSAGLGLSERFQLPFIQEVVASAEVVKQRYPRVRTLIDIGGEDAKVIFLRDGGVPDIRMNGSCAGGTGAFIDQMAALLNVPVSDLNALAETHTAIYPIASRCGVFAKTDVQNLLSREIPPADITASIYQAVVLQTLATLARGHTAQPDILFSGGPLTFMPLLKTFFMRALGVDASGVVQAENATLLPAIGAALARSAGSQPASLKQLARTLASSPGSYRTVKDRLAPLFADQADFELWQADRFRHRTPAVPVDQIDGQPLFLGIDSGSTTTKVVLVDEQGRLAFSHYANNRGNALRAVKNALVEMRQVFEGNHSSPRIAYSVVTGYGEDLIRTAFGFDEGIVETLAHFGAAKTFDPQVSFVLDIGGQDMKAIFVQEGCIQDIEINEACSSGCGSFIETFAESMGYTVEEFARLACTSQHPCDLGTRCTVFMNSRVKQALRENASIADISAGLAYSVIKNAIHKVLKITDMAVLGQHILVQGGTFHNLAIHKAMENLVGRRLLCPDISALMGAYGAALAARDTWIESARPERPTLDLQAIDDADRYQKRTIRCHGCENKCAVTRLTFANHNVFTTGNRCERVFSNSGRQARKGRDLLAEKHQRLFDRPTEPTSTPRATLGIPRVLNMYENYPFWSTLFVECGFRVRLSDPSSTDLYQAGVATIMSGNICFPAKLAHGHIYNLIEAGVDRIFYPMVVFEQPEFCDALNSFNCPIVTGYPDVILGAIDPEHRFGVPFDQPSITFQHPKLLKKTCLRYLSGLGVDARVSNRAYQRAVEAQRQFKQDLRALGRDVIARAEAEGRPVILLMGRPYHADPLINHRVPEILAEFGVDVITEDAIPLPDQAVLDNQHVLTQWEYPNRYYHAARWMGEQPNVEMVHLNSFGCGPDAIAVDEVKSILAQYGKRHTVVRVDEIDSIGSIKLRLRSLIESLGRTGNVDARAFTARKTVRVFDHEDRIRTILAPSFSHFYAAPLARPIRDLGFNLEILPPADRESAEVGLRYTNNEICYPAIIVIGDLIKALKSGRYDPSATAVTISQTGGQCRASSYLSLLKRALIAAGFADVPVVSLTTALQPLNQQPGARFDARRYATKAAIGIIYADALSTMYHATAVREVHRGQALALADRYLDLLASGSLDLSLRHVTRTLKQAVVEFNRIEMYEGSYPKVGLVGEIYIKYNEFGNNSVVRWLMDQGIDVVVPPLIEFFAAWPVNAQSAVEASLKKPDALWLLSFVGEWFMRHYIGEVDKVLRRFRHYRPAHAIRDIAGTAQRIVKLVHQYGEGWMIPGEIGELVRHGVQNVLCLQPFGCIANHVVAKGVARRLKEVYPQLNLLILDADAGLSEVNYLNRLYFFIDHVRQAHAAEPALVSGVLPSGPIL